MDYHYFKNKLNQFYDRYIEHDKRPTFFEIGKTCAALNKVTEHFPAIKTEFEQAIAKKSQLPRYHDIDPGEQEISNACEKNWNVFMLSLLGYELKEAHAASPTLSQLLSEIPGLIQAFFSILDPGKSIPLHEGPYRGYLRYHLGIQIPKENPPQIIINQQPYTWRESEAILFDDSWPHEVQNQSNESRVVLIIDILRPMPFLPNLLNRFVTHVLARYFYGRPVLKRAREYGSEVKPLLQ